MEHQSGIYYFLEKIILSQYIKKTFFLKKKLSFRKNNDFTKNTQLLLKKVFAK